MSQTQRRISHSDTSDYETLNEIFLSLHDIPEEHTIDRSLLNIDNKTRSNLLSWKGQFSPQLVEILLQKYAEKDFTLFDPFLGSGTLIVEAARNNLSAYGSEINPAAYHLSSIYHFCNYNRQQRIKILNDFEKWISINTFNIGDLFYVEKKEDFLLHNLLDNLNLDENSEFNILSHGLIILLDIFKNGSTDEEIRKYWIKLRKLILELPVSEKDIRIINTDARIVEIDEDTIDLVITSPPYINVFNYHQQYRASAELLGENVLVVARSEIGSNRKHRGNRYFTVTQYIFDMHSTFLQLQKVCKKKARIIFVVGRESNVRKTSFYNSEIIASVARIVGLEILFRQERVFRNRFGQNIYEDIIHFENKKGKKRENCRNELEKLALEVFVYAVERAPEDSKEDLHQAMMSISKIQESPIYKRKAK